MQRKLKRHGNKRNCVSNVTLKYRKAILSLYIFLKYFLNLFLFIFIYFYFILFIQIDYFSLRPFLGVLFWDPLPPSYAFSSTIVYIYKGSQFANCAKWNCLLSILFDVLVKKTLSVPLPFSPLPYSSLLVTPFPLCIQSHFRSIRIKK